MSTTSKSKAIELASGPIHNWDNSLYRWYDKLMRRGDRYWIERIHGGGIEGKPREHLDRDEATDWIATEATDGVTGFGYTRDQAALMIDGHDAGQGRRGED